MRGALLKLQRHWTTPVIGLVLAGVLLTACLELTAAIPQGPGAGDRRVTRVVKDFLEHDHLSKRKIDDEVSSRALDTFLESLDPRKLFFTQADVDKFHQKELELDDEVKVGNVKFAYDVFHVFLARLQERVAIAEQLAATEHDFTVDEAFNTDFENLKYPADDAEARDRWRKLVKLNLLAFKADGLEEPEARQKIVRRYRSLAKRWGQTDGDELLERFLTSVTTAFDPHTTFMSPSSLENFRIIMRLNLEGIGAALQINEEGETTVTKIIPGGAAFQHGKLKKDDKIVSVGQGINGEMVDVTDMKLNDTVGLIRGRKGTVVRLGVIPEGSSDLQVYNITRAKIELEDQAAQGRVLDSGGKKLGVVDLPSFYMDMEAARGNGRNYRSTTRDVRRILKDFKENGVDCVILDLRQNGGGSLTEAINLTGLFIDEGPVVQVKDSAGRVQKYNDLEEGMEWDGPLVVLTSKFSASASEILAGAIQDYHRGLIVGDESTHGKGTVQSLLDLSQQMLGNVPRRPNLGALKITMQQFYRPNGDSTQKHGVVPDLVLPSLSNEIGIGEADLDYAIDFSRIKPARYTTYNQVAADTLQRLRTRSTARVQASEEFAKQQTRINRYKQFRDEKRVPLNEAKYNERRDSEKDVEEEEEKHFEAQNAEEKIVFKEDDFYNKEVIAITIDYLNELAGIKVAQVR